MTLKISNKLYFVFSKNQLLVPVNADRKHGLIALTSFAIEHINADVNDAINIARSEHGQHFLVDMQQERVEHADYELLSLREALGCLSEADFQHLAQAWQYALFLRQHRYCGQCGSQMHQVQWEMAMHCHRCQHRSYPRVSPCIIVAVRRGNKILLAKGVRHQTSGFFSTLAGFVESGETLEHAVHREIKEEVGIEVKNLEYFGSQAWPFPHSIMVGFLADYADGDLVLDKKEILEADYFDIDDLPTIPPKLSIAGRLIEETINRIKQN
jgi:NAD+ diphosphatase